MEKYFIITIDTEEDNQWDSTSGNTTNNVEFLPRFQELAERYNYKPVWLTTYSIANNKKFVSYFKKKQKDGLCEIGMHLHAWNNPPKYELKSETDERSYLIEYPTEIMEKKIKELDTLLTKEFEIKPISHRSGRWATNKKYFELLTKYGYKVDCSVTPHINWENNLGTTGVSGSDYRGYKDIPFYTDEGIFECPLTIEKIHSFEFSDKKSFLQLIKKIARYVIGKYQWVRPDKSFDTKRIKRVIDKCNAEGKYIMFMIHSSELMPNGSPNFKTDNDIERLYDTIETIFEYIKKKGYVGISLREYYERSNGNDKNRNNNISQHN